MSYTKTNAPAVPVDAGTMQDLIAQFGLDIASSVGDELLAAGAYVTLDSGQTVWASCIVHDRPETLQIDLLSAAIEVSADGPRHKPNGQLVAVATWRGVMPEHLDAWTCDTVRKACLMIALGEAQPQVPIPNPATDGPTQQDVFPLQPMDAANGSIRSAIGAADQLAAPLADVL